MPATVDELRFLMPDVALVQAKGAVVKGGRRRRRNTRVNTTIAVRTDGRWLLAASQNTTHRRVADKLLGRFVSQTSPLSVAGQ
jgi:uncharacterized protein (TIGR02246 family)